MKKLIGILFFVVASLTLPTGADAAEVVASPLASNWFCSHNAADPCQRHMGAYDLSPTGADLTVVAVADGIVSLYCAGPYQAVLQLNTAQGVFGYSHLDAADALVRLANGPFKVNAGQVIGRLSSLGSFNADGSIATIQTGKCWAMSSGPHLHFTTPRPTQIAQPGSTVGTVASVPAPALGSLVAVRDSNGKIIEWIPQN